MRWQSSLISQGVMLAVLALPIGALDRARTHGARPADLEGHEWTIASYFVGKEETWPFRKIGQKGDPYISFESGVLVGSPGCGRFTGTYARSRAQFSILAEWIDQNEMPCGTDERKNAEQILKTLNKVKRILVEPGYWDTDSLLLADAKGSAQITLSPMQPGRDLSEFQDSFWHLAQLEGSHADLSGVIVEIEKGAISFSSVSYFASFPFRYKLSGLRFYPASTYTTPRKNTDSWRDWQIANLFLSCMRRVSSYDFSRTSLTFIGEHRQAIMVLNSLQQEGIEMRRWRIAKYRGDGSQYGDEEGLVDATEPADITFLHGRIEGSPGCGGWEGTYKISGDHLTVQADWIVAGFCYPAGFAQNCLVEAAFKNELRFEPKDNHVVLRDATGKAQVLLIPF